MYIYNLVYDENKKIIICSYGYKELFEELEKRNIKDIKDIFERKCIDLTKDDVKKQFDAIDNDFEKSEYIFKIQRNFLCITKKQIDKNDSVTLKYHKYCIELLEYSDSLLLSI